MTLEHPEIFRNKITGHIRKNKEAAEKAKLFIEKIDVTTCNDMKYAKELRKRFIYTMGGTAAVEDWKRKGWGQDVKAETTLTKILTAEEILKSSSSFSCF